MAHSRRHTPITGITTAPSEKDDKRRTNRTDRRINHEILATSMDDSLLKGRKAVSNPWTMAKDGKHFFDAVIHPRLMRK